MANDIFNSLLKEYDYKRLNAELDLEKRKTSLYSSLPRLEEIENELNKLSISSAKSILTKSTTSDDTHIKIEKLKKEKSNILESNGIDYNYLQPKYECDLCKDTGFITKENYKTVMCSCLKQKLLDISFNKSNIFNINSQNFNTFNPLAFSNEVNYEKYNQKISPRQNIINIKKRCEDFVKLFDNTETKNLLFTGNTGCGKTFMSNCIASEILKKYKTVLYQTAPVLLESIIDYKMSKNKNLENNIYKTVSEVDLLIIDDLGTESINSMKLSELFTIINTRIINSKKTIISTNLNIRNIFNFYEERIGSRIAGYYDIYYFFGDDLRFKTKNKNTD